MKSELINLSARQIFMGLGGVYDAKMQTLTHQVTVYLQKGAN